MHKTVVLNVHLTNPIVFERYLRIPDLARSFKQKGQAKLHTHSDTLRPSASYQTTVGEANKADLHLQPFGCQVFYRDHRNPVSLHLAKKKGVLWETWSIHLSQLGQ